MNDLKKQIMAALYLWERDNYDATWQGYGYYSGKLFGKIEIALDQYARSVVESCVPDERTEVQYRPGQFQKNLPLDIKKRLGQNQWLQNKAWNDCIKATLAKMEELLK